MSASTARVASGGKKSKRIVYFDVMRAFAPLAIIMIHVLDGVFTESGSYTTQEEVWAHGVASALRWAVPVFVMMSGALFLNPERKFDWKKHFRKNVLRLLIAFIVWQIIYAVYTYFVTKGDGEPEFDRILHCVRIAFGQHYVHLWFLVMLLAMYLMVPILRKVTEDRALMKYFLIIGIVFIFALPLVGEYCQILQLSSSKTNPYLMGALGGVAEGINYFRGKLLLNYMVYFVLGYYLATTDFSKKQRIELYLLGAGAVALSILISPLRVSLVGAPIDMVSADADNINFLSMLLSVAVFVFMRKWLGGVKKVPRVVSFMAKHSFGVFLVHMLFLDGIFRFIYTDGLHMSNIWYLTPLFTVVIYCVSLGAAWIMSKLPLIRKVI